MFNYNTGLHEATKHTRSSFRKNSENTIKPALAPEDKLSNYDDYLINLVTQLHKIQNNARKNVVEAKFKSKKYYDKKINPNF